jgi:hypothetical protein
MLKILKHKKIIKFLNYFNIFLDYTNELYDEIYFDYFVLRDNLSKFIYNYKKLGLIKHLILIFLFFAGVVPLFIFIYFCFFFIKYMFKYIFVTLDFFVYYDVNEDDYDNYYNIMKIYVIKFFDLVPLYLVLIYRYIFKSR